MSRWLGPPARKCHCGSGEYSEEVYDAKGIYVTRVCSKCRSEKLKGFRQEIFDDPGYECDEPIEEEE